MRRCFAALLLWALAGCGTPALEPVVIEVSMRPALAPQNESPPFAPHGILLTLEGPEGIRTEMIDAHDRSASLADLLPGIWRVSADAFDEAGALIATAEPVVFEIAANQTASVALRFLTTENQAPFAHQ
jgi:hypothetical protein